MNDRFETSAKDNINIEEAARYLVSQIMEVEKRNQGKPHNRHSDDNTTIRLDDKQQHTNGGCC